MAARRIAAIILLWMFCPAMSGAGIDLLKTEPITSVDAEAILSSEMKTLQKGSHGLAAKRFAELEEALRVTYATLPKNDDGNLGHQAVRYVLHRLFVHRHGWYIRGLEPGNDTWHESPESHPGELKEWIPSYMQDLLERKLGHQGTDLQGLVTLAASLEDLISQEATDRVSAAYRVHGFDASDTLNKEDAQEVLSTFYVIFLLEGNITASSAKEMKRKKGIFATKYADFEKAEQWFHEILDDALPFSADGYDFQSVRNVAVAIGERYHKFNDRECKNLKSTLQEMEGKKAGRVRLSQFYKKGLYSHWQFTEKADYLRTLGALDESEAGQQQVLLSNYLMSRPNCLQASGLYALCCQNDCENLMGHLEQKIMAPEADAKKIAALVSELSSDTVKAPRTLPQALVQRLSQVADINGGKVPLHGRLFAQWMHHAFPRECPYPHEGTTTPATPDEWMEKTGEADSQMSPEEMRRHVESDTCSADSPHDCADETPDLPWSDAEQLLNVAARPVQVRFNGLTGFSFFKLSFMLVVAVVALLQTGVTEHFSRQFQATLPGIKNKRQSRGQITTCQQQLLLFAALLLAVMLDLLDWSVFACTVVGGALVSACRTRTSNDIGQAVKNMVKLASGKEVADAEFRKCCV